MSVLPTDERRNAAADWSAAALTDPIETLRRSPLCQGLRPDELVQFTAAAKGILHKAGDVIIRQDEPGHSLFIIARGRVKISLDRGGNDYGLLEYLGRGAHFGDMAVLTDGMNTATATAVMDTELLELPEEAFHRLMVALPRFAANLSRRLGMRLRHVASGKFSKQKPAVVGLVNSTLRTQGVLAPLAQTLVRRGDSIVVLTDRGETWPTDGAYLVERIRADQASGIPVDTVQRRIAQVVEHEDRVLLDLTQRSLDRQLPALLSQCEEILWLVEPAFLETSCNNLERLLAAAPELARKIHLVWILHPSDRFAPPLGRTLPIHPLDFKVVLSDDARRPHWRQQQSIHRIVRHLCGTRVGLALSGGGARGFAHLGVLRAFDRAGLSFDLLAGTSIGALTGLSYCAGWDPDEAIPRFADQLTPPKLLRMMPGGYRWFMYGMFRLHRWDGMLRPYLGDCTLEQLQIPLSVLAVDLITGTPVISDQGDAVGRLMESINLPGVALPILRDGMALVDGGILNNLPADVLPERGANLVIGVDVMAKLSRRFGRNRPSMTTEEMRVPGTIETLLRVNEVQDCALGTMRSRAVDLLITPDTSRFDFANFTKAQQLADIGEAAAQEAIPQIKQLVADLERG